MTSKIAFVFPGQGSQSIGMLSELSQSFPQVAETFKAASEVLDQDLWQIAQAGPETLLNRTDITQPLMLAADIAVYRCWQISSDSKPELLAGHSLGEYAALVVAEALSFEEGIALVAKRGRYMQQAVPEGVGAMAAIVALSDEQINKICTDAAEGEIVAPANFNSIGQTVIAGNAAAVDRAIEIAKGVGAKIAKRIPVSVPSHCDLMQPAAEKFAKDLENTHFNAPVIDILHNADVSTHHDASAIREILARQLVAPVRWVETIETMQTEFAVDVLFECGPGKVLAGLIKRINRSLSVFSLGASLQQYQDAITFCKPQGDFTDDEY